MMLTVQGAGRITQMSYFSLSLVKRLPNTWELYCGAARRTPLPRTPVNKDNSPRLAQCGGLLYSRGYSRLGKILPRAKVTYEDHRVHRAHADPTSGSRATEAESRASHARSRICCIRILHRPSGVAPFAKCSTHPYNGTLAFNLVTAPGLECTRRVPQGISSRFPIGLLRSLIYPHGPLILPRRCQAAGR